MATQTTTHTSPTITTTTTTTVRTGASPQPQTTTTQRHMAESERQMAEQEHVAMSDHARPLEMGHGYGESVEQHQAHSSFNPVPHFGLQPKAEMILFYCWAVPSWAFNIVSGIMGSYYSTHDHRFIVTVTIFQFLSWAAWWQTAVQMMQRASWVRDEGNLADRKRYLYLAVRLNRLMFPTAVISFCVFIVAYVRRRDTGDLANWLIFILIFIFNTVGCVMNAYNNITWESDRLEYEEGSTPYGNTLLAVIGIPSKPRKAVALEE